MEFWVKSVQWALALSKKHAVWLTNQVRKDESQFTFGEDDEFVKEMLKIFEKAKKRPEFEKKDINEFDTYRELQETLEPYREIKTNKEQDKANVASGLRFMDKHEGFNLYEVLTYQAAKLVSNGASWCVKHQDHWENYIGQGPMFFVEKESSPYSLIHYASNQYKNVYNYRMGIGETMPILPLMQRNLENMSIEDDKEKLLHSEFDSIARAGIELETIKNDYSQMSLEEFKVSLKVNKIFASMANEEDESSSGGVWEQFNILLAGREYLPEGSIEFLTKSLSDHTISKTKSYADELGGLENPNGFDNYSIRLSLNTLSKRYTALPLLIKKHPNVGETFGKSFEVYFKTKIEQDLIVPAYSSIENKNDINTMQGKVLSSYNSVPIEFRKGDILNSAKEAIEFTSSKLFENGSPNVLSGVNPLLNYDRIPKELRGELLIEKSTEEWAKRIASHPASYQSGVEISPTNDYSYDYDDDGESKKEVKLPADLRKQLRPVVTKAFDNLFNTGEVEYENTYLRQGNTTFNGFTEQLERGMLGVSDVPDFIQTTDKFQGSLTYIIKRLLDADSPLGGNNDAYDLQDYDVYDIINGINPRALTPEIFKGIKELVPKLLSTNFTIDGITEIPDKIKALPGMMKIIGDAVVNSMGVENMRNITFLKSPNNNINVNIPDEISERQDFRNKVTEMSLSMMSKRQEKINEIEFSMPYGEGKNLNNMKEWIPDYVADSQGYEGALDDLLLVTYRQNFNFLMNSKLETPKTIETLEQLVVDLQEIVDKNPDKNRQTINLIRDTNEKIEKLKAETEPLKRSRMTEFWDEEALPQLFDVADNETTIFIPDPRNEAVVSVNPNRTELFPAFDNYAKRIPEIDKKLKEVYEKDKDKINIDNLVLIKTVYKNLEDTDITRRAINLANAIMGEKIAGHDLVVQKYLPQYVSLDDEISNIEKLRREIHDRYDKGPIPSSPEEVNGEIDYRKKLNDIRDSRSKLRDMTGVVVQEYQTESFSSALRDKSIHTLKNFMPYQSNGRYNTNAAINEAVETYNVNLNNQIQLMIQPKDELEATRTSGGYIFSIFKFDPYGYMS